MKRKRLLFTEMLKNSDKTRKIFLLLAAVTVCFCMTNEAMAQVVDSGETGDCTWTLTGTPGNYTLTIGGTGAMEDYRYSYDTPWSSYNSSITALIIEDGVTSIGKEAFYYFIGLTSLTLPNSVISIGSSAFGECRNLTSITLSKNLTNIGTIAFSYCRSLTSITIPESVTSIGDNVFYYCLSLAAIHVEDGNTHFSSDDGILINNDETTLLACPAAKTGDYTIPDGVTSIEKQAFTNSNLTSVIIPEGVTTIGEQAFWYSKLKNIRIAKSVTCINYHAFNECQDLTDITVYWNTPSEVTLSPEYPASDIFEGVNKSAVFLHVPASTEAAYQTNKTWKDFYGIDWTQLRGLTAGSGTLEPDFAPGIFSYRLIVPFDVESIVLSAIPFESSNSTVSGDGEKALNSGKNTFETTVTSSDGKTRNYTINVYRLWQPENYLLEWNSHTDKYTQAEITYSGGKLTTDIITGRYLYYTLQTGNFSGNLPLHFDLGNAVTCEHTVAVQPNSLYKITLDVSINSKNSLSVTTPYDAYGNPGKPYVEYSYRPWTVTALEGDVIILFTETTIPGTVTAATVSEVTLEGNSNGILPVEKASLRIYPNPVSESFRIEGITVPMQITVTDINGRSVFKKIISGNESIAVNHWAKGVYLVHVNGKTAKIIKN
jgi:hypothetical protein